MSKDSVNAINEVINKLTKGQTVDLIGFSGGGGIAALVTAQNHKVRSIITIAGNLDHKAFNDYPRADVMEKINTRIELLLDRNYTLGHSYFIKEDFKNSFKNGKGIDFFRRLQSFTSQKIA